MRKLLLLTLLAAFSRAGLAIAAGSNTAGATDGLSDHELFDKALKEGIGNCYLSDARRCRTCFADYYVKSTLVSWRGKGWPVNPRSKDSTGAVVPAKRKNYICWNGYAHNMCHNSHKPEKDVVKNAAAQLRDAIKDKSNPCGLVKCTGKDCGGKNKNEGQSDNGKVRNAAAL